MTHPKLTICLVSPVPPPYGGIGHWTLLMQHLAATSSKIRLFQVNIAPSWRAAHDLAVGKRVLGGGLQLVRDYGGFLTALLKKPDLVHLTTSGSLAAIRDLMVCTTAWLLGVPVVYHIHFGRAPEIAAAKTPEWRMMTTVMRMASVVLTITPATTDVVARLLPHTRVKYIPNPVNCSQLSVPMETLMSRRTALFLGHILPTKGVEELVQAWAQLAPEGWELLIVGPGNTAFREHLMQRYQPQNLVFAGELNHDRAMQLMARCDLFVLPSHTEGFPYVILEAMASARAIVATSVGAIPDMLSGGCGLIVNPRDIVGLKEALTRLIQNDDLRYELGQRARERVVQEYSTDVVFAQYIELWQSLAIK